jgi:hypothetical protein
MATLVLSTAGRIVGGPIGGAIGAFVGQQIDRRLFAPKARRGPQLGDLAVQTSNYGSDIPKVFGRMRVAGTVIWSTDLQERRSTGGGGKGRPKTVDYSYSASFAVALSGRRILGVRRIWADGKLLRGEAGDFKSATGYRLHLGAEDQAPDPLIVSLEGAGETPAYRGLAYAVFENMELADFGNRIPSLSFEVEADAGEMPIGALAEELSGGDIEAGPSPPLIGYAAGGDSLRAGLEELAALAGLSLSDEGDRLLFGTPAGVAATIDREEFGAGPEGSLQRDEANRTGAALLPGEVTLSYYDPERDFQTGLQRATRGQPSARGERRSLAGAMSAASAKALTGARLQRLWAGREAAKVHLPWARARLRPGALVEIAGREGLWRATNVAFDRMAITLELQRLPAGTALIPAAAPGRAIGHPDELHGTTTLIVLDAPLTADQLPSRPQLAIFAAGAEEGWRRAELTASWDGGATWQPAGSTAPAAVMGSVIDAPPASGSAIFDLRNAVEVELLSGEMWLESRTDEALAGGANLAAIGDELIQFGRADPLGGRRFRLSRLLRGRRGTEWASAGHVPGEPFVLIDPAALVLVEPPLSALGGEGRIVPSSIGDGDGGTPILRPVTGEAVRPPSPVHLRADRLPSGDVAVRWVRRSRNGWTWLDGADTPLGEEREAYRLMLTTASSRRTVELGEAFYLYTAAQQLADGAAGPLNVEAVQLGTVASSRPISFTLV